MATRERLQQQQQKQQLRKKIYNIGRNKCKCTAAKTDTQTHTHIHILLKTYTHTYVCRYYTLLRSLEVIACEGSLCVVLCVFRIHLDVCMYSYVSVSGYVFNDGFQSQIKSQTNVDLPYIYI